MRAQPARAVCAAAALILTGLSGCEKVQWGGAEVRIVKPPPPEGATAGTPTPTEQTDLGLPRGNVVFHVVRSAGQDRIVPVAEISGDSLRALQRPAGVSPQAFEQRFRQAVLPPNAQYVLFRRGAKVGTFTLAGPAGLSSCGVPIGAGQATTVAAAAADQEFLAFRKGLEPDVVGEFSPPQVDGPIRRYAPLVAERQILTAGLPRPGSWTRAQRDLQAMDLVRGGTAEMATTFLSGDNLAVGAGDKEGWSVFYVAAYEQRTGYNPIYSEVADYRRVPKRAPHAVDYLNWNGKGGNELLIQVFGPTDAWYEAISADRGGRWVKVWEGKACR
ncbi:MAG TPA: hypothetical protein VF092_17080 [Longimicrobium sp.]